MAPKPQIVSRVPPELYAAVGEIAEEIGQTKTVVIVAALRHFCGLPPAERHKALVASLLGGAPKPAKKRRPKRG